jgi:hypothetical protein
LFTVFTELNPFDDSFDDVTGCIARDSCSIDRG